jgi:hypothetical protein
MLGARLGLAGSGARSGLEGLPRITVLHAGHTVSLL